MLVVECVRGSLPQPVAKVTPNAICCNRPLRTSLIRSGGLSSQADPKIMLLREFEAQMDFSAWLFLMAGGAALVIGSSLIKAHREGVEQRRITHEKLLLRQLIEFASALTKRHLSTLARKRQHLVRIDDYGNECTAKWEKEVGYFVRTVVVPEARLDGRWSWATFEQLPILLALENTVECEIDPVLLDEAEISLESVTSGVDYELFCKSILEESGWSVQLTSATSDQGADLIAELTGFRMAFQCKFYSSAVGNKAVQEAYAAKAYYKADCSCVVSNASFTSAAQRLAHSCGVLLLHHEDLRTIAKKLQKPL